MRKPRRFKAPSWKAVKRGDVYCSPSCGYGCTVQAYERAKISAVSLCERLGSSWKPRVWENMGWHFSAVSSCGRLRVHTDRLPSRSFHAYLGEADINGGRWSAHGVTPESAVAAVRAKAMMELVYIDSLVSGLPGTKRSKR